MQPVVLHSQLTVQIGPLRGNLSSATPPHPPARVQNRFLLTLLRGVGRTGTREVRRFELC